MSSKFAWVLVLLAVVLAYSNHFHNGFHFDDCHVIENNPAIRDLHNLPRFFTDAGTFSVLPANRAWRPLLVTSLAVDYWLGHGLDPFFFQLSTGSLSCSPFSTFCSVKSSRGWSPPSRQTMSRYSPRHGSVCTRPWRETVNYICQRADLYSTLGVAGITVLQTAMSKEGDHADAPAILASLLRQSARQHRASSRSRRGRPKNRRNQPHARKLPGPFPRLSSRPRLPRLHRGIVAGSPLAPRLRRSLQQPGRRLRGVEGLGPRHPIRPARGRAQARLPARPQQPRLFPAAKSPQRPLSTFPGATRFTSAGSNAARLPRR